MARKTVERNISYDDIRKLYYVSMDLGRDDRGKRIKQYRTYPTLSAARAGLLHDLYLYDPRQPGSHQGNQCFAHPKAALSNAWALCGSLTPKEENIIISHMWPLARKMPRYRESFVVNLADKTCATLEVVGLYRYLRRRRRRKAAAAA